MKVPSTLDPRRRRGARPSAADDGYEYEYRYIDVDDPDAFELDDEWEWVEVDDDHHDEAPAGRPGAARTLRPSVRRRGNGTWRRLLAGLPTSERADLELDRVEDAAPHAAAPVNRRAGADRLGTTADRPLEERDRFGPGDLERAGVEPDDVGWDDIEWDDDLDLDHDDVAVDPRIAARRDGVEQARRTRLRRRLVAVAVVFALLLVAAGLTRSALLDVDEVVVTGADRAEVGAVVAASGIAPGTPLIGLDLDQAAAGVRSEPWVLDATVERSWDGTVGIAVVERTPVATVNAGAGGWLLIDSGRRVVAASTEAPPLPIVDGIGVGAVGDELGPDAQAALDVAAALTPALRTRVAVVNGADPRSIELTLQPSGTVRFGPATAIDERMRALQTVFARVDLVCLESIDLRVAGSATLKRVPGCA